MLSEVAYSEGDYEKAMLRLAEVLGENFETSPVPATNVGLAFELAGDIERAIDWYEIAYRSGDQDAPYLGVTMASPAVQSHSRFIALLRDMKLDYWADKYSNQ